MKDLQAKREELEKKLKRKEAAHYGKAYWHSEGAYQDSVLELRQVYNELFKVALELGDPVPEWF
jgi:hypothetical protein